MFFSPVFNREGCIVYSTSIFATTLVSILCVFVSALSSFLSIVLNKTVALFTARLVPVLVLFIWTVAVVLAVIVGSLGRITLIFWPGNFVRSFDSATTQGLAGMYLTQSVVSVSLVTSVFFYLAIYVKVRVSSRRINTTNNAQRTMKERKTAARLFCICMTFCITYLPASSFMSLSSLPGGLRKDVYLASLYWYRIMVMFDPLLYGLLFSQIKLAFYSIILRKSNNSIGDSMTTQD